MSSLLPLIQNETIKVLRKNRFYVILLILIIIIPVFTYAQMKTVENNREKFNQDWRLELQQRITDIRTRSEATGFRRSGRSTGASCCSSFNIILIMISIRATRMGLPLRVPFG